MPLSLHFNGEPAEFYAHAELNEGVVVHAVNDLDNDGQLKMATPARTTITLPFPVADHCQNRQLYWTDTNKPRTVAVSTSSDLPAEF